MNISDRHLLESLLHAGIARLCEDVHRRGLRITGFSLCTDDEHTTLFHVATALTVRGVAEPAEFRRTRSLELVGRTRWAVPVDWEFVSEPARIEFDAASDILSKARQQGEEFDAYREEVFSLVCDCLSQSRSQLERVADSSLELLLLFISTGGLDEPRDLKMARRLNSDALTSQWRQAVFAR